MITHHTQSQQMIEEELIPLPHRLFLPTLGGHASFSPLKVSRSCSGRTLGKCLASLNHYSSDDFRTCVELVLVAGTKKPEKKALPCCPCQPEHQRHQSLYSFAAYPVRTSPKFSTFPLQSWRFSLTLISGESQCILAARANPSLRGRQEDSFH